MEVLDASYAGISQAEAAQRLAKHGPNALPVTRGTHPVMRFLAQFNSALIYFLLAAAFAAALLGHVVDACVIGAVVLVNAIVGFAQEGKAQRALSAIRDMIAPHAAVLRDGARRTVAVHELVPGDVVMLEAGDRVPADLRLLKARGLLVDEAPLTGESIAVEKQEEPVDPAAGIADRRSMAFSGTLVASGQASGLVVVTGAGTQIGRISAMLQRIETTTTPLLRQINDFARRLTLFVLAGATALFTFAVFVRGFDWVDALIAVVALSVGVVPEGLPAVITITLAIGVQRMAARNAVIRRLPAVETLGAISVICTDKTGTLTRNEMMVKRVLIEGVELAVGGSGYTPEGGLATQEGENRGAIAAAGEIIRCGLLCNDATLRQADSDWIVDGDPMEGALVALAMKAGLNPDHARGEWRRIDEIPFDAAYRFMATLQAGPAGDTVIFIKGAPEAVMAMAGVEPTNWEARLAMAAGQGERLLGFGVKRLAAPRERLSFADLDVGVEFLGAMGFIDPPREEARAAIRECRSAGIAVKMITGDHAATALAIARQLGISEAPVGVTGAELEALSDETLSARVLDVDVFARTSPEHKLRIVRGPAVARVDRGDDRGRGERRAVAEAGRRRHRDGP